MDNTSTIDQVPKVRRRSAFVEVGLFEDDQIPKPIPEASNRRPSRVRFLSQVDIIGEPQQEDSASDDDDDDDLEDSDWGDMESEASQILSRQHIPTRLYRLSMLVVMLAIAIPLLQSNPFLGKGGHILPGASGGVIRSETSSKEPVAFDEDITLYKRQNTQTAVCKRWSHQSAIVNGTMWIYGGQSMTDSKQTNGFWNNDFLTLDLTRNWQIGGPALTGLSRSTGPPKVSNGYLWNSRSSLFFYGGEYSENPQASPGPSTLWEYNIRSSTWTEHRDLKTSAGVNAEPAGQPVQRSAEGAGFNVASLNRGWYFGGHLDFLTTQGWDISINRTYLKSLVEYNFPGSTNPAVEVLSGGKTAGPEGVWRNITQGGLQADPGFTERADGVLVFIPGYGKEGILLGLGGGIEAAFTQMNVIDVYDIATSTWYKQGTSGRTPVERVNPCAVVAAAADGSSYNVYMFGGQNLQPAKQQIQKDEMWILSVPSFTWIQVDQSDQPVPPARSGHTCHAWDSQMIVVGGYVGQELTCDSPGIYVFNMSSLEWRNEFVSLSGRPDNNANREAIEKGDSNPWSQQLSQKGVSPEAGLEGSYGYAVPDAVIKVIGGNPIGGATITAPVQVPTAGPLATGKPITYTVTGPGGSVITSINPPSQGGGSRSSTGVIVAGVLAGVFGLVAIYLAFCALLYRKQLQLYKKHTAMVQQAAADPSRAEKAAAGIFPPTSGKTSSERQAASVSGSGSGGRVMAGAAGAAGGNTSSSISRRSSGGSSTDDLLAGQEPTFWGTRGVLLNPRRSLRVINRD